MQRWVHKTYARNYYYMLVWGNLMAIHYYMKAKSNAIVGRHAWSSIPVLIKYLHIINFSFLLNTKRVVLECIYKIIPTMHVLLLQINKIYKETRILVSSRHSVILPDFIKPERQLSIIVIISTTCSPHLLNDLVELLKYGY